MPNLNQLLHFRELYGESKNILESVPKNMIKKAFDQSRIEDLNESFDIDPIKNIKQYFLERKKVDVVMLFIDITNFSTKYIEATNDEIVEYLNYYYETVIPIIYEYGGEIEKTLGDGIICVFGEPFLKIEKVQLFYKAEACAANIIKELYGTEYQSKIAFHSGEITYYDNCSDFYSEYTMIGKSVTELFRLESISEDNSINYYSGTAYDRINNVQAASQEMKRSINSFSVKAPEWFIYGPTEIKDIKGIEYESKKYLKYEPPFNVSNIVNKLLKK
jgi:class 3 adenylate cyclase